MTMLDKETKRSIGLKLAPEANTVAVSAANGSTNNNTDDDLQQEVNATYDVSKYDIYITIVWGIWSPCADLFISLMLITCAVNVLIRV
jgi:hypothetical protein